MTQVLHATAPTPAAGSLPYLRDLRDPVNRAYHILHVGFIVPPILAGADKCFGLLATWDSSLAPAVRNVLGGHSHTFMLVVGVIEILAGIGVALRPRIFAYVVAAWLAGIILNLLLFPPSHPFPHYDVALRDLGLCLGALALGRLSSRPRR